MTNQKRSCVLLADRHRGLRDGIRELLETEFETVIMVANEGSLLEGAESLNPAVVVLDMSLAGGNLPGLLTRVVECSPDSKILMITVHDEATVAEAALAAGAAAVIIKSRIATDLLLAVDAVRAGQCFLSPGLAR